METAGRNSRPPRPIRHLGGRGLLLCLSALLHAALYAQINVENTVLLGRNALSVDDNVSAIHYFNQAIAARPTHSRAYYYRAYAKFVLEDYAGAEADCTTSIGLNPFLTEVYQLRGLCRVHTENYRGAVSDYSRTLREMPTDEAALFNRALCYLELHEPDSAEAGMDDFLRLKPGFYRAYMFKAQVALEERHDTLKALTWIDSVLVRHPDEPSAWQFKGQWAAQHEAYEAADSFLTQAIAYQVPPRFETHLMRAQVRHALSRFGQALEDYDRVIEIIPEHFAAHYNRALLRALVGDDNRAIEDFTFILGIEPDNTLARYNRALLSEQTGDYRGAIADYTELIRAYPDFLYGYYARAQLRRKLGDLRGALNDETVIARHNLDIAFAKPRRSFTRKVRERSEHELDQYDQVISTTEETRDTARVFGDAVFGKVQNTHTERELLPMFALVLHPAATRGYQSNAYFDEAESLSRRIAPLELATERAERRHFLREPARRLLFSAETKKEEIPVIEAHLSRLDSVQQRDSLLSATDYLLLRAALLRSTYRHNEAQALTDTILATNPDNLLARMTRAAIETAEERTEAALADLALVLTKCRDEERHLPLYNRACLYARRGDYPAAIADLDAAIALDSRFAEAYYNRAVVHLLAGEANKAAPDLSRAGELGLFRAYNLLKQVRGK
ncbi:MAG: tetratricopeptide repeat protein [Alloprevotella sp.]|nr:tetratricopeptide repeat protein [Alloprevotella sp.]